MSNINDIKLWREIKCFLQSKLGIEDIIAGDNVTVDKSNPKKPIINSTGTGGGGISSVSATLPLTGNGLAITPLNINSASSSTRGTMSVAHYNKLENVDFSTFMLITHPANGISSINITNWNTAYGWGNHALQGYITASSVNTLTNKSGNISMWNNDEGYLTSVPAQTWDSIIDKPTTLVGYGITDAYPLVGNPSGFISGITSTQINNALGYTPYNGTTNPNEYITTSALSAYATISALSTKENIISPGNATQYWRGDKTWQILNKTAVGLSNVNDTSDANKPVSTPQQTALNLKEDKINKVTAFSATPTDTNYPSEKLVKDSLNNKIDINNINITTSTDLTTDSTDSAGVNIYAKNVIVSNGSNNINLQTLTTSNANFSTVITKAGTGSITFIPGAGTTIIGVDYTNVLNGAVGSTAKLQRIGNVYYLRIFNA